MHPLGIKWVCGGKSEDDVARLDELIKAFPQDAKDAGVQLYIDTLVADGQSLTSLLGREATVEQRAKLCAAAIPLNLDWVKPDNLSAGSDDDMPEAQKARWEEFWGVVERLQ